MPKNMKTWLISAGLAVGLLTVAACGGSESADDTAGQTGNGSDSAAATSEAPGAADPAAMPEADVADVPDVVAEVNGVEISGEDFVAAYEGQFQQAAMQAQASGQEVDQDQLKTQTVDGLVANELLVQAADEREITSSAEEVDSTLEELATGNGLASTEELMTLLEEQGTTEDDVRSQVETQVKVDKLIEQEAPVEEPTDAELQELYDSLAGDQGGDPAQGGLPPLEEVRPQLVEQLREQEQSAVITALVDDLRAEADVTVNL